MSHLEAEGPGPGVEADLGRPRPREAVQPRDGTLQAVPVRKIFYSLRTKIVAQQTDRNLRLVPSQSKIFSFEFYVIILCS